MPSTRQVDTPQSIPAVSHDRRFQKQRVFEEFFFDVMGQVFQVFPGVRLATAVDKVIDAHCCLEAVQLPFAQPFLGDIDKLEGDPPFFEIPLRFPGVPALEGAEDLYVQGSPQVPSRLQPFLLRPHMLPPLLPRTQPPDPRNYFRGSRTRVLRWSASGLITSTRSILPPPPDVYPQFWCYGYCLFQSSEVLRTLSPSLRHA